MDQTAEAIDRSASQQHGVEDVILSSATTKNGGRQNNAEVRLKVVATSLHDDNIDSDDEYDIPPHVLQKMNQATERSKALIMISGITYLSGAMYLLCSSGEYYYRDQSYVDGLLVPWILGAAVSVLIAFHLLEVMKVLYGELEPLRGLIRNVVGSVAIWKLLQQPRQFFQSLLYEISNLFQLRQNMLDDVDELCREIVRCGCFRARPELEAGAFDDSSSEALLLKRKNDSHDEPTIETTCCYSSSQETKERNAPTVEAVGMV